MNINSDPNSARSNHSSLCLSTVHIPRGTLLFIYCLLWSMVLVNKNLSSFLCPFSRKPWLLDMFNLITFLPKIISLLKFTHTLPLRWLVLFKLHTSSLGLVLFSLTPRTIFLSFYFYENEFNERAELSMFCSLLYPKVLPATQRTSYSLVYSINVLIYLF